MDNSDVFKQAWHSAIAMLSRREHTAREIADKLGKKDIDQANIEQVLEKLQADGYQSDSRFTEHYIRYRGDRGYGPLRIRMELKEKGVAEELIEQGIQETEIDWYEQAERVRQKKFKGVLARNWEEKMRQVRFLNYRGFSQQQIDHCLDADPDSSI